ncbi:MAG TPA: lysylphosphatidylglycerol synthase transmembrane domain-containing protein, partial [Roseimicrobium sp.]|nr:lysylphosphatidylglycerol synthase transmembrane domain-containing protein [Roseimicrobium sp.]
SFVLVGATLLIGIVRWRMALKLQGLPLSFVRTGEISLVAHFFNSFLLGSTGGDLLKAYYAARETHHLKAEAVTTVFVDRLIGLFSMLLFACLMMVPNYRLLLEHEKLAAVSGLVVAMLLACGGLVAFSFWGGLDGFLSRWSHLIQRVPKAEGIKRSLIACRRYGKSPGFLLRALSWSMLLNLICVLQAAALCRGLGINIPFMALSVIIPIIICISALPITPSGLGLRENLFVLMLAAPEINVDATRALSLSLLVFFGSLAWSMLGGLVYACLRQSQHLDEIDRDEDATVEKP